MYDIYMYNLYSVYVTDVQYLEVVYKIYTVCMYIIQIGIYKRHLDFENMDRISKFTDVQLDL